MKIEFIHLIAMLPADSGVLPISSVINNKKGSSSKTKSILGHWSVQRVLAVQCEVSFDFVMLYDVTSLWMHTSKDADPQTRHGLVVQKGFGVFAGWATSLKRVSCQLGLWHCTLGKAGKLLRHQHGIPECWGWMDRWAEAEDKMCWRARRLSLPEDCSSSSSSLLADWRAHVNFISAPPDLNLDQKV